MSGDYEKEIREASELLAEAFLAREKQLEERVLELDGDVLRLVRRVGRATLSHVLARVAELVVARTKSQGLTIHRSVDAAVTTILGPVKVPSPYLRNAETKETARPVKDILGLYGRCRTPAVQRAMVDFGIEDSFELASARFLEHYGHEVGRTSMLRVVESCAVEAESFVADRLAEARRAYDEPIVSRPGVDQLLVELDGSMVRTGVLVEAPGNDRTPVRELPVRQREESWREHRVAFARVQGEVDRTYVARMDKYPRIVGDLFSAAVERGLSSETQVFSVGDGGNGLRDELDAHFANFTFLLDRPHLKQNIYAAAEALGLVDEERRDWVGSVLTLIDAGHVDETVQLLKDCHPDREGSERVQQLAGYLERFRTCLDYAAAHDADLPLGSGEIESAHRYIPQKRLKLPGACWAPRSVNPMLALRILRANGWWDDFWRSRADTRAAA